MPVSAGDRLLAMTMRFGKYILGFLMVLITTFSVGQDSIPDNNTLISKEFKPSMGLGIGVFDFYGDVNNNQRTSILTTPLAYELYIYRKINGYSDLGFTFLTGELIGNQYGVDNTLNFKTAINSGSVFYTYNFGHFLKEDAVFTPHVALGIAFFNFNSKGDLFDASGNRYHYWDDGTIRNIAETSPLAEQARVIQRDYFYETDLRNADLDGLGKYSQNAFAFPLTIGANLKMSDRLSFRLSGTIHFTTTDLVDNVSNEGEGTREGNALNDHFVFYSAGLHYDLLNVAKRTSKEDFDFPDFFVLQTADTDGDGIIDEFDICPFTPAGVQVDKNGCPLDKDADGVWDYADQDTLTPRGIVVNQDGTEYTAEQKLNWYLKYRDSLEVPVEILQKIATIKEKAATYRILVGEYPGKLPEELIDLYLAEPDIIGALNKDNETAYLVGKFGSVADAEERAQRLLDKGFPMAEIVVWEGNDYITLEDWRKQSKEEIEERFKEEIEQREEMEGYYAIEIGSTPASAHPSEKVQYLQDDDVIVYNQGNGENSFVKGPYIDSVSAVQNLRTVDPEKYPDAKVVRIENGEVVKGETEEAAPSGALQAERVAYQENKKKLKERLSGLEGAFVVDFGKNKNPKVRQMEEELSNDPEVTVIEDPTDGSKRFITNDPAAVEQAEQLVDQRKQEGFETAAVAKVENGEIKRLSQLDLKREKSKAVLSKLEGKEVLDISEVSEGDKAKMKSASVSGNQDLKVVEVIDENNQEKVIAYSEKGDIEAVSTQVEETIKAAPKKAVVENGRVVNAERPKKSLLDKLNGSIVIDLGPNSDNEKVKDLVENDPNVEIIEDANGSTKIIDHSENSIEGVQKRITKLKQEGIQDAAPAKVESGKVVPLTQDEIAGSSTPQTKSDLIPENIPVATQQILQDLEDKFVVQLGVIDETTSEEEKAAILGQDNVLAILKADGSVEIIENEGYSQEQDAQTRKQQFQKIGLPEVKVAKLDNGSTNVLAKEKLEGQYTISLGSFEKDVPNDDIDKILSIPDVQSIETFEPEMTTYTVGSFDNPEEAKKRMMELASQGFEPEMVQYKDGKINKININDVFAGAGLTDFENEVLNPSAMNTNEIVFRVQLGAYRNKISEEVFKGVNTLAFPANGGVTKYVTGSFNTYKQAYIQKIRMREMGFGGAFVVAYKDGKRIKVTDLVNQDEFSEISEKLKPVRDETQPKQQQSQQEATSAQTKQTEEQITYKVQIGAYKDLSEQDKIAQFTDVEMEVYGEYKRFLSGDYSTFSGANKHKEFIQSKGYPNAFVVAYKGGERITAPGEEPNIIKENEMESSSSSSEYDPNKLMILVQIGLYSGTPPQDVLHRMNELPSITKQVTTHGVVRYMTGNFKNPSEAAAYKEELIEKGFIGPFLVAYYDNERVDIKKAIEIYQSR